MRRRPPLAITGAVLCVLANAGPAVGFGISTPAFRHGEVIPTQHTCDGANASPPLEWGAGPPGTKSFAVIVEDPDIPAGSWVLWVVYDVPAGAAGLPPSVPPRRQLPSGARQGVNDFHEIGWGGPCPQVGRTHHYWFRVYALDAPTGLEPGATMVAVMKAMHGHVLSVSEVMGTFARGPEAKPGSGHLP